MATRKSLTKQQRKQRAKRQQAFDAPPKNLRIIDKFGVFPLSQTDDDLPVKPLIDILKQGVLSGQIPVYLADDVAWWLMHRLDDERWYQKETNRIQLENIYADLGVVKMPTTMIWVETTLVKEAIKKIVVDPETGAKDPKFMELQGIGHFVTRHPPDRWLTLLPQRGISTESFCHRVERDTGSPFHHNVLHIFSVFDRGNALSNVAIEHVFVLGEQDEILNHQMLSFGTRVYDAGLAFHGLLPLAVLAFLNVHNIKTRSEIPVRTKKIQRFERDTGKKLPTFEHTIIDLWPERPKIQRNADDAVATGIKMRFHHVCGFFRTRLGKKEWVRPHTRGDKRLGTVVSRKRIRLETVE